MTVKTVYFEGRTGVFFPSPTFPLLSHVPLSSPALLLYPSPHLVSFPSPILLSPLFTLLPIFPAFPLSHSSSSFHRLLRLPCRPPPVYVEPCVKTTLLLINESVTLIQKIKSVDNKDND